MVVTERMRVSAEPTTPSALRSTARLLAVSLTAALALALIPTSSARAEEVYPRPSTGAYALSGHGFGHGIGMSQWGANGAAARGLTYQQILAFYYPGTTVSVVANSAIRVRLAADAGSVRVSATAGLAAVLSSGVSTTLPAGATQWRLVQTGSGLQLQALRAGAWAAVALGGSTSIATPVRFVSPSGLIRVWRGDNTSTDYRGSVAALPTGSPVTSVTTVLTLPLESYLRGVVPRESPSSWPAAALQSQAVAARSYAVAAMRRSAARSSDVCDTTACQVFGGTTAYSSGGVATPREVTTTDAAVTATAGRVLVSQGAVATTMYSSSNGGWTVAGGASYLTAHADPYDGAAPGDSQHSWSASLPVSSLEAAFPVIGALQRLVVVSRDGNGEWGGRVLTVRLEGSAGVVTTTGARIAAARPYPTYSNGMHSNWFVVNDQSPFGSFDGAPYAGGSTARAIGWAVDPNAGTAAVSVAVTVDGRVVAQGPATVARPDVATAVPGYGPNHGFDIPFRLGGGSHTVCANAINVGVLGPYSARLRCIPWTMSGPNVPPELRAGSALVVSPAGGYWLGMQTDGNLVLYSASGSAHWATMTNLPGSYLRVQSDGNVVLYEPGGFPVWTVGLASPGARLTVQEDGNLVLYAASGVALWDSAGILGRQAAKPLGKRGLSGLTSGAAVTSYDGRYRLTMQAGGNLVLATTAGATLWTSRTSSPGAVLKMQSDGNVVVYATNGTALWNAGLYSPGARLALQNDGNLVVYDGSGRAIWDALGFVRR